MAPRTQNTPAKTKRSALERYKVVTRDPINSLVMVAPLFVIYQIGILMPGVNLRNGADFLSGTLWRATGYNGWAYTGVNLAVLMAVLGLYFKRRKRDELSPSTFGWVAAESTIYAMVMGGVAARLLMAAGFHPPIFLPALNTGAGEMGVFEAFVMSVGAGAYEELTFRLLLSG